MPPGVKSRWIGLIGAVVCIATWMLLLAIQRDFSLPLIPLSPGWQKVITAVFAIDAMVTLGWSSFTLSAAQQEGRLALNGPYAFVRHPIYGVILWNGTAATAAAMQSWLVLLSAVPLCLFWTWLVQAEEAGLAEEYGDEYDNYRRRTGQFLPRLSSLKGGESDAGP